MNKTAQNNQPLIELAKYYMEFLENDFKVGTAPKRVIETQHKEHEFVYYRNLKHDVEQLLVKENDGELIVNRDSSFVSLTTEKTEHLNDLIVNKDLKGIEDELENIQDIKPYFNADRTIKNVERFLKTYVKSESGINPPLDLLKQDGQIVDLYQYIEEKYEQQKMENDTQFYLYIGSIKHNKKQYPLFFIPLDVEFKGRQSFEIELGNIIHIHKKAIEKVHADYRKKHPQTRMLIVKDRKIIRGERESREADINQMQLLVNDIADTFGIQRISLFEEEKQEEGNPEIQLSNHFSFALFEKSDEMILNDYAEMLDLIEQDGDTSLADSFFSMTRDYLTGNPKPFEKIIDADYDNKPLPEKFSFPSPIPLNKEQKQIVNALNTEGCDKVVVEGPPGTGKSHTISGVAYDAIINGKSVLIVSDSMEALDVVEDKITEVLSKVEEENISNPILRLGKKNSNLSEIFNQSNVAKLKMRFKRYSTFLERNTKELKETENEIQSLIKKEIEIGEKLTPKVMEQTFKYEPIYEEKWSKIIPLEDFSDTGEYEIDYLIATLNTWYKRMQETKAEYTHLKDAWNVKWDKDGENVNHPQLLEQLNEQLQLLKKDVTDEGNLELVADITKPKVKELQLMIEELESAKSPIFGYFLKGSVIKEIQSRFVQAFPSVKLQLKDRLAKMKMELEYYKKKREESSEWEVYGLDVFSLLSTEKINSLVESIKRLNQSVEKVHKEDDYYAHIQRALNLDKEDIASCFTNPLGALTESEFNELITYMQNVCTINNNSYQLAEIDINESVRKYENMLTTKMNYILDQNLLEFLDNNRTDAQIIRKQLRQRRKIHKEQFMQLIRAFPCIIVGIRELGEMIPLEPGIFDLCIIDEGSQVSIAQAFPALVRAKKVLVLGDSKQFGNVKSTNASLERNENLFRNVKESFAGTTQQSNNVLMEKVKNFDVKNSVLDFATNISNYNTILRKHFRSYYELISYSNKHFYTGSLEVMKIRSKPLSEVIHFYEIEAEQVKEEKNINRREAAFILEELEKLKQTHYKGTVGIITPFRDQQQYISAELLRDRNLAYYEENFRIKVMTFDTCQGEERDVIFYSMVETPNKRNLSSIFPVKELVEDENRRSQRLNVGLSRAKEEVRFVISQSLDAFTGEIGKALRHFESQTHQQDVSELYGKTDKKSPMENKLLNLITQTSFYQEYQSNLEIIPQFNMGKFIKQLDPYADVKDYKTDFLIVFHASSGKTKNVILEYDGFEYHFRNRDQVNEWNYDLFYTEEDIERQKTIEMYGYPFIRVNKFVMNNDPINFLNEHLEKHLGSMGEKESVANIPAPVDKEEQKEEDDTNYKYCNGCGFKKPRIEFYDDRLKTKYGLKCLECKSNKKKSS